MTNDTKAPELDPEIHADKFDPAEGEYMVKWSRYVEARAAQGALIEQAAAYCDAAKNHGIEPGGTLKTEDLNTWLDTLGRVIRAHDPDATAALEAVRREAVEQERERCARIAEKMQAEADSLNASFADKRLPGHMLDPDGNDIAAAIRDTPPQET